MAAPTAGARARALASLPAAEAGRDAFLVAVSDVLASSLDYHVTLGAVADLAVPQLADWCAIRVVEEGSTREIATSPLHRDLNCTATLVVPMAARGRVVGSITLAATDATRRFTDADRSLAKELARRAAIAVDHAWLFDAAERARRDAESARQLAEAASRAKSQFLAVMSHELRTPLNAIAGHVQLLEMGIHGSVTDAQRDALQRIERSQRQLLHLINNVLNLERIESGHIAYEIEDVSLRAVVGELAPMIEPQLAAKDLTYDVRLPSADVLVRADPKLLGQILLNLLSNAVKFTPSGGRITLDTTTTPNMPGGVFIRVTDTGIGIPRYKQPDVFEPFVQVHTGPTRTSEGAGLGLAISRDLARTMGGDLRVRSVEGGGSTFTLRLLSAPLPVERQV
jgi:signal transduction histidine kinase